MKRGRSKTNLSQTCDVVWKNHSVPCCLYIMVYMKRWSNKTCGSILSQKSMFSSLVFKLFVLFCFVECLQLPALFIESSNGNVEISGCFIVNSLCLWVRGGSRNIAHHPWLGPVSSALITWWWADNVCQWRQEEKVCSDCCLSALLLLPTAGPADGEQN